MKKQLFQDKVYMDEHVFIDLGARFRDVHRDGDGKAWMRGIDVVSLELERMAERIRKMKVRTHADWVLLKDTFRCPNCGSDKLDID